MVELELSLLFTFLNDVYTSTIFGSWPFNFFSKKIKVSRRLVTVSVQNEIFVEQSTALSKIKIWSTFYHNLLSIVLSLRYLIPHFIYHEFSSYRIIRA